MVILTSSTKECDNYSVSCLCIKMCHVHHDKHTVGLLWNPKNVHYSVFAWGHKCSNIHTYTCAVYEQTKTHRNASGSCHNRPPLMEWCLINRRLAAKEWRYLSHFHWAMVTALLLSTNMCPQSIAQTHPNWKQKKRQKSFCYNNTKYNVSISVILGATEGVTIWGKKLSSVMAI